MMFCEKDHSVLTCCRKPLGIWCSELCCVRPGMSVGSPVFLKHSGGNRTLRQSFGHFLIAITAEMHKIYIHVLRDSAVSLCTPSFSVFPLCFLSLPHSAPWQLLSPNHHCLLPRKKQSAPAGRSHLNQGTRKGLGEEADFPLFSNTPLRIRPSE